MRRRHNTPPQWTAPRHTHPSRWGARRDSRTAPPSRRCTNTTPLGECSSRHAKTLCCTSQCFSAHYSCAITQTRCASSPRSGARAYTPRPSGTTERSACTHNPTDRTTHSAHAQSRRACTRRHASSFSTRSGTQRVNESTTSPIHRESGRQHHRRKTVPHRQRCPCCSHNAHEHISVTGPLADAPSAGFH
jgi:hypothetical protein